MVYGICETKHGLRNIVVALLTMKLYGKKIICYCLKKSLPLYLNVEPISVLVCNKSKGEIS